VSERGVIKQTNFALIKKRFCFVMIFPTIHTSCLMIPSDEIEREGGREGGEEE
jgi:hypothetical protein